MHHERLATGLTVAFGAMSVLLVVAGVVGNPAALVLAAVFGTVTGLLWYHASGRLASRVYRRVERQAAANAGGARAERRSRRGGFGAGPREEWTGPHRRERPGGRQGRARRARSPAGGEGVGDREAYDVLGVDPGADADAVRAAYRERIKEVHPDTEGGDEEAFRRVRTAYERLSD